MGGRCDSETAYRGLGRRGGRARLALEFALFLASGWTPATFSNPEAALAFLESGGSILRAAAFVGFLNLGLTVLFIAGLAGQLQRVAPSRSAALLYVGLVGIAAHALVPLGLWLGTPFFAELAARDMSMAFNAWGGFAAFLEASGAPATSSMVQHSSQRDRRSSRLPDCLPHSDGSEWSAAWLLRSRWPALLRRSPQSLRAHSRRPWH